MTMAVRSKADAGQFREKARSMYFSNETIDWFLENSSAAQMRCVADLLEGELSDRERNKRVRLFRRATFASQPQVPCPMPGGPSLPVARYACRRFPTASRLMPGRLAVDSQPAPLLDPQPRPRALCPPSGMRSTFLTSTWTGSPGLSRPWRTGVTGPRARTSPVTRSTSARRGRPRLATILTQVRAGTPVAAASPSGASSSPFLAATTPSVCIQ